MWRISLHSEKNWIRMIQKPKIYQNTELGSTFTRHDRLWKVCLKSVSVLEACGSGENMGGIGSKPFSCVIIQDAVFFI